jgi:glycosyltransferase involved in cell wall biosynthesis
MSQVIKVLHLSTHNEECGIAKYQEQFLDGMKTEVDVEHVFFGVSPNKTKVMAFKEYDRILAEFTEQLKDFDILHIQHELSFYKHKELQSVMDAAAKLHKKVIVTVHTALEVEYHKATLNGFGAHSIVHYLRQRKDQIKFEAIHLTPLKRADLLIVHNKSTKDNLVKHGLHPDRVRVIRIPVPDLSFGLKTNRVAEGLQRKDGDIIFATVGFVTASKGVDHAVKALNFLPPNYKLAIIGGVHPNGSNERFMDEICDYIVAHNLQDRVYIAGYISDDQELNALIRECDICVYAYDKQYYSFVSSASLSNAFANHKATIAYQTESLLETNNELDVITFTRSPNYYELARELQSISIDTKSQLSKQYAELYAYDSEAKKFAQVYRDIIADS